MLLQNTTKFDVNFTSGLDRDGREMVVVASKATYDFPEHSGDTAMLSETQEPLFYADEFGPDPAFDAPIFENDFAPFKQKCDVLCHGPALAPGGKPVTQMNVGIRVGNWSKSMTVHGPRIWLRNGAGHQQSERRSFVRQDISYDVAFGGSDPDLDTPDHFATFEPNPAGVGYYPNRVDRHGAPLPVTAELGKIVDDVSGPHRPMAFGPLGRTWLPRRGFTGTYDEAWLADRIPLVPDDFDDRYYQAAPPDQQIPFPTGEFPVEVAGLTPEGRFSLLLPSEKLVVTFQRKGGPISQKIANLDTVLLLPERRKICLTWRTRLILDRDIFDIAEVIVRATGAAVSEPQV